MKPTPDSWKEARRLQAWHLKQQGWSQRRIAEALGVSEGAVSRWMKRGREWWATSAPSPLASRGTSALVGRAAGPEAYGFRGQLGTRARIAAVIQLAFGVSYHPRHVGRLCQALRWSPQKPVRRARQRDETAIVQWREETWPALKKGRRPSSRRSS